MDDIRNERKNEGRVIRRNDQRCLVLVCRAANSSPTGKRTFWSSEPVKRLCEQSDG